MQSHTTRRSWKEIDLYQESEQLTNSLWFHSKVNKRNKKLAYWFQLCPDTILENACNDLKSF